MMPEPADGKKRREERVLAAVAREAARFVKEETAGPSLVTVTRAAYGSKNAGITVFISVLPSTRAFAVLAVLERKRDAFLMWLKDEARISPAPKIAGFALDDRTDDDYRREALPGS